MCARGVPRASHATEPRPAADHLPSSMRLRATFEPIAVIACTLVVLWLLWCASTERIGYRFTAETRFGLLGWRLVEGFSQPGWARLFPWIAVGKTEVRPMATAATAALSLALITYAGLIIIRLEHNRRPRDVCVRCGHRAREGSKRLVVCPECGAMPNARPSPFMLMERR